MYFWVRSNKQEKTIKKKTEICPSLHTVAKIVKSWRKLIAIFAAVCKPEHKWENLVMQYKFTFAVLHKQDS